MMRIPFLRLDRQFAAIDDEIMTSIRAVLAHGQVLQGPTVTRLEEDLAHLLGRRHCVAVNSGTDALIFAVAALGLAEGSRIAVPAMTFVATGAAILHSRCRPVFVDVDPTTLLADTGALLRLVKTGEVEAVMAVHLYGQLADLAEVADEARRRGIPIVEDAAQALGATRNGAAAGTDGDIACISFDPMKTIGAYGSGGAVVTDNAVHAESVRRLRYHGQGKDRVARVAGFNSQMDELQAAILSVKLRHLGPWQVRRAEIAARYTQALAGLQRVQLPTTLPGNVHNHHKFVIATDERDALRHFLAARGIGTKVHYDVPLHRLPCFAERWMPASLPFAERAARSVLSLPIYAELADGEVNEVIEALQAFLRDGG